MVTNDLTKEVSIFAPPAEIVNMKIFDEKLFNKTIRVPCVKVEDRCVKKASIILTPLSLKISKLNPIQSDAVHENLKVILLDPQKVTTFQDLSQEDQKYLSKHCNVSQFDEQLINLSFDNYPIESIMKVMFKKDKYHVTGWSVIGHILHLNLKSHVLPHKKLIGEILLRKNQPLVKTVINKVKAIDNQFRNFHMEVIAQSEEGKKLGTIVEVKALKCTFKFDFAKVYWNPRLNTEHERIVNQLSVNTDVVYDLFSGIGPFAVPAAKKKCKVFANDLNPEAYKWLQFNSNLNKTNAYLKAYNMDARAFVQTIVKPDLIKESKREDVKNLVIKPVYHILMNLPKIAVEFLDVFQGLMLDETDDQLIDNMISPLVHCYHFLDEVKDHEEVLVSKIAKMINYELKDENINEIKNIRSVAPNRSMYRVSFVLPKQVFFLEQLNKKQKLTN